MRAAPTIDISSKRPIRSIAALPLGFVVFSSIAIEPIWAQDLDSFAILAGTTITNTGSTTIDGNVGLSPGTAYDSTGITLNGTAFITDEVAARAQADLTTLYNFLAARPTSSGGNLTGQNLGNRTLLPGVYNFDTSAGLGAGETLTLNGNGNPDSIFIFNIGSTLTTLSGSEIVLENGAHGGNVFFRVGSSATIGTTTSFVGQIVALTSISLQTEATIDCGAALARNAAVTLDTNTINVCVLDSTTFEEALDTEDDDTPVTENAEAIAALLDAFETDGGTLPAGFALLAASLTLDELREALAQLSGEVATGVAPSNRRAMGNFLDLVVSRSTSRPRSQATRQPGPASNTVSALGYAPVAPVRPEFAAFDLPPQSPPAWNIWTSGFGGYGLTAGDDDVGSRDRTEHNYGIVAGVDFFLNADTTVGFAVGKTRSIYSLEDDAGAGTSDLLQAAVHLRAERDAAYVTAALGYGYGTVSTERSVTIAGLDRFGAEFEAHTLAADLEAGYQMGIFTPYLGINAQSFDAPAYSETVLAGVSTYSLSYEAQHSIALATELGIRLDHGIETDFGRVDFGAGLAWTHALVAQDSLEASFQAIAGSQFDVQGAGGQADMIEANLGMELSFDGGLAFGAQVGGDFSANAASYDGAVTLSYAW
ncbi:ice-binding family protein [Pelagibacterium montanilacus]|uniref:ice-binding family protein n=1 Tax=Pelagibacterium montanilacus TaxID=2185280 RepID=UPI000F8F2C73|nr:ice-binding family protein [Pelagibacterium montanilacus]